MARLIVVSNRVPGGKEVNRAGGLEVAVRAAFKRQPGLWLGWGGEFTEAEPKTELQEADKTSYLRIALPEKDYDAYYNGFANSVLWPILHYRLDLAGFSRRDLSGYVRVNEHFADALEKVLTTLRPLAGEARVVCVFGCGGNRDKGKRPLMGRAAAQGADQIYVTSDNPRNEDPLAIIADILHGVKTDTAHMEPDRAQAIFKAVGSATADDIVLIAGKGHEDYQEVQGQKLRFSDIEVAQEALKAWMA